MSSAEPGGRWTPRSVGSRLQHDFFYLLIRLGGRRAAYFLLHFVVAYYTLFRPELRSRSRPYRARRFPDRPAPAQLWAAYRLGLGLGRALIDRAAVGILGPAATAVRFPERARLLELLAEGRGLLLVTAHVGCWQAAMAALGHVGVPVNMLMQRDAEDLDRHYFEHRGEASPFRVIDPTGPLGGALEMMAALKRGEVLCVMGDRPLGSERGLLPAEFLGAPAPFPYSGYKVAGACGAPAAILLSHKTGAASYDLRLVDVLRPVPPRGRRADPYRVCVQRFARSLDRYVARHPYQFFNFFDMWRA